MLCICCINRKFNETYNGIYGAKGSFSHTQNDIDICDIILPL